MEIPVVYSRPYDELALKTDKYAQSCVTLHLGDKGITHLQGFEKFSNLNTLFLNNNRLTGIEGLETNFRIKQLYLHNNRIRTLQPQCFAPFVFLNVLTLNGNMLDDLEGTIEQIKTLGHLKSIDLFDNPIAQEDNYRKRVICELSDSCEVLDRHNITPEERVEAQKFKIRMAKLTKLSTGKKTIKLPPTEEEEAEAKRAQTKLDNILANIRKFIKDSRPKLEEQWLKYDKRELGIVTVDQFWEVLRQFGMEQMLREDERDMLTQHLTVDRAVPALSASATHTLTRRGCINYFQFVWEVVPSQLQLHPPAYVMDRAPDVSVTANDLNNYVKTVHRTAAEAEATARREALERSRALMIAEGNKNVFGERTGIEHKCLKHGLDPWSASELSRLIAAYEPETNPTDATLKYSEVQAVFRKMMRFKLVPETGINKSLEKLFGPPPTNGSSSASVDATASPSRAPSLSDENTKPISAVTLRSILGTSTTSPKCFSSVSAAGGGGGGGGAAAAGGGKGAKGKAAPSTKDAGSAGAAAAKTPSKQEVPTPWVLKWRTLTDDEEAALTAKVNDNAAVLLDKLLRLNAKDDPKPLLRDTLAAGVDLARMNNHSNINIDTSQAKSTLKTMSNSSKLFGTSTSTNGSLGVQTNKFALGTLKLATAKYAANTSSNPVTGGTLTLNPVDTRADVFMFANLSKPVLPTTVNPNNSKLKSAAIAEKKKKRRNHSR